MTAANDRSRGFEIVPLKVQPNGKGAVRENIAIDYMGCGVRKLQGMRRKLNAYRVGGTWWYPLAGMDAYFRQCFTDTWDEK